MSDTTNMTEITQEDIQNRYSHMQYMRKVMLLESRTEGYEQLVQRFFDYMQGILEYYLCIFKEEAFEGEMEMLPPEARAAVWLNRMFSREENDWDGKLSDLRECVRCYPVLRNNVKHLVQFIVEIKQNSTLNSANRELMQMVELMKDKIRSLAEQGLEKDAAAICAQVRALAPQDRELARLEAELTGEIENRDILLSISILCSGRSKTTMKCLESLEELRSKVPSELIIVDTGCNDELHRQLTHYADVITRFEWCDDFSKARNAGLKLARGQWFLYLDDDEWFVEIEELVEFFTGGKYREYAAARYIQRNYLDMEGTQYTDSWVMRMIKLDGDIHFQSRIHEYLTPVRGKELSLHAVAEHYGYVYETKEALTAHYKRNSTLLKAMIEEEPQELRWYMLLAQEYRTAKMWQELYDLGTEGLALVDGMSRAADVNNTGAEGRALVDGMSKAADVNNTGAETVSGGHGSGNFAAGLALGSFYGAQIWALKEQGKLTAVSEHGVERVYGDREAYERGMELCGKALADTRNMELTKAFCELHMCWFAYWLGKYEEAILHGMKYFEWKDYFADKENRLIEQRTAPFAADSFDIVMEKQTYSILICADLRIGNTHKLEQYLDRLGWQEMQSYVFEDMIPALVEVMDEIKDTNAGQCVLKVMQGHKALWNYYTEVCGR